MRPSLLIVAPQGQRIHAASLLERLVVTQGPLAGWYPDPNDITLQRYWDGRAWTPHTAPAASPAAPQASMSTGRSTAALMPPPPPRLPVTSPAPNGRKKWLIGGAIAAGVIIVGSAGAAIGGAGKGTETAAVAEPSSEAVPLQTPAAEASQAAQPAPAETSSPPPVEADPVAFRAQANSHLDDMNKDLDDIIVTVEEKGFWRLLSNSVELSFNLGQLEALELPPTAAQTWPASLVELEATLDALSDAVSTQDGASILVAVDGVRAQVVATRAVADATQ